jgi:hypothetical protein
MNVKATNSSKDIRVEEELQQLKSANKELETKLKQSE